jgi:hypothetical protein
VKIMSSYHSSFSYLNKNSNKDFKWLIVHFDADNGETDGFMGQEQVYDETYRGTKRIVYGTKWTSVAEIKITVIKQNGKDFTLQECRDAYRWLTGNNQTNWLDLYAGEKLQYSFLVTNADVKPQKLDARTVGLNIYFQSISPWAYSPQQFVSCSFGQTLKLIEDGVVIKDGASLKVDESGILSNSSALFSVESDGTAYIDNAVKLQIDNKSDDLYTYIYLDTKFTNYNSDSVSIKNITLGEETTLLNMAKNEVITLSSGQFIMSDRSYTKIFGDDFNWTWPRLGPGINEFIIGGSGQGAVEFTYRYPMKIGDLAIDVETSGGGIGCGECTDGDTSGTISGPVTWGDILDKPTTRSGYNIQDVYTMVEVDTKLSNLDISDDININEDELNAMLSEILGE